MAKKKKRDQALHTWLVKHLRYVHMKWPHKNDCMDKAKVSVHIGFHKNGNPEFKVMFKCNACKELFERDEMDRDHINPVVDPTEGRQDWNAYIPALFAKGEAYQALCKPCHQMKTDVENEERGIVKRNSRKSKKDDNLY